jgi:predicted metal-dependent hydrolase
MFNRQEASRIREEFWTTFGRYMSPVPSAEGLKINWINYRTTFKDVYFRMEANQKSAVISIAIEHYDAGIRELYFQQFQELKTVLHAMLEEAWEWHAYKPIAEDKIISSIYKELPGISVFNKEQWPELISFFKPRIIALDRFWEDARYSFEALR